MPVSRLVLMVTLMIGLLAAPLAAEAQPPSRVPRIGFLQTDSPAGTANRLEAFRQGLRDLRSSCEW